MFFIKKDPNVEKAKAQYRTLIAGIKASREERDFAAYSKFIKEFVAGWMGIIKTARLYHWENQLFALLDYQEMMIRNCRKCLYEEFEEIFYANN